MKLKVATCQFPVDRDILRNTDCVLRQLRAARDRGADLAHFSETCLSGYAGVEFPSFDRFDWDRLLACTQRVLDAARRLRLWVVLGSSHRLTGRHKPHNCLYIINARGQVVERYDKMFCTGGPGGRGGDLDHYSPGSHLCVFTVKGIRCGALICHDFRYPELFRAYKRRGVQLMLHSYHNGHMSGASLRTARAYLGERVRGHGGAGRDNIWGIAVPATMQASAASNFMWISANNTSARHSSWPSFFVHPDGVVAGRLAQHRAGVLLSRVDTGADFYDASAVWRDRAMRGICHSGRLVKDRRSAERRRL